MTDLAATSLAAHDPIGRLGGSHALTTISPGVTPFLALGADVPSRATVETMAAHVAAGGRAVVAIGADATDASVASIRPLATVQAGPEHLGVSAADPLLAERTTAAITADGRVLQLSGARPLSGDGTPLARLASGEPVALELRCGAGRVAVVGSAELFHERWLTIPENATFASLLFTGVPDAEAYERFATTPAPSPRAHAVPPVVHCPPGWLADQPSGASLDEVAHLAGKLVRTLPAAVFDALAEFTERPPASGALLLKGMPTGHVPPTPASPTTPSPKDLTSETALLTVARALGQPVGYEPELGGRLVQNICPTAQAADRQVSTSSKVELMFHTEAAFHPFRPRFLLLLCLRQDPERQATTTLAAIGELLEELAPRTRRVLFEARFRTAADESYVGGRPTQLGAPRPILSGDWDAPSMVFDAELMVGVDAEAEAAVSALTAAITARHTGARLEPGDLLVVDNAVAVHGRSPFRAHFDGTDRWLQRAFVVADLVPSAADRRGRIITTRFAR